MRRALGRRHLEVVRQREDHLLARALAVGALLTTSSFRGRDGVDLARANAVLSQQLDQAVTLISTAGNTPLIEHHLGGQSTGRPFASR